MIPWKKKDAQRRNNEFGIAIGMIDPSLRYSSEYPAPYHHRTQIAAALLKLAMMIMLKDFDVMRVILEPVQDDIFHLDRISLELSDNRDNNNIV